VAIKVINLVEEEIVEIYSEINILRMCKHPNIVKYFGIYLKRNKLWVRVIVVTAAGEEMGCSET